MDEQHTTAVPYGYCQCGCGELAPIARRNYPALGHVKGQPMRYISGHHARKHGHGGGVRSKPSPTHRTWESMLARCYKPATRGYARYGGRGIAVCDRWHSFENFLADMGERPPGMSIDRIDSDGNYEPGNCRWATRQEQEANKKREDGIPVKRKAVRRLRIREMWELGASAAEIAAVINTSATAVSQEVSRMRRDGIALPSRQVDREARREALRRKALNLRQAGQTNREIAECLGMSPVGVAGLLNELRSAGTEVPRAPRRAWTESWSGRRDR